MIAKSFPLTAVPGDEQGSQSLLKKFFSGKVECAENGVVRKFLDHNKPATTLVEFCKSTSGLINQEINLLME